MAKKTSSKRAVLNAGLVEEIREQYVYGIEVDGKRAFQSVPELSISFNVQVRSLQQKCMDGGWRGQRKEFEEQLRRDIDAKKRKELVDQTVDFDTNCLRLAQAIHGNVRRIMQNAEKRRETAESNGDPLFNPLSPTSLVNLSSSLTMCQKVGRLALGTYTDSMNVTSDDERAEAEAALESAIEKMFDSKPMGEGKPH
jgi:hypothetical protein